MWCFPEAGRAFRARREETEALRCGREEGSGAMDARMLAFLPSMGRDDNGLEGGPNNLMAE